MLFVADPSKGSAESGKVIKRVGAREKEIVLSLER